MRVIIDAGPELMSKVVECQRLAPVEPGCAAPKPKQVFVDAVEAYLQSLRKGKKS